MKILEQILVTIVMAPGFIVGTVVGFAYAGYVGGRRFVMVMVNEAMTDAD